MRHGRQGVACFCQPEIHFDGYSIDTPEWIHVEIRNLEVAGAPVISSMTTFSRESWPEYLQRLLLPESAFPH